MCLRILVFIIINEEYQLFKFDTILNQAERESFE